MARAAACRRGSWYGVAISLVLTAIGVAPAPAAAQSIAIAPGAPLHIALRAADVTIVGRAGATVRVLPIESGDTASTRAVTLSPDPSGGVRLTGASGVTGPRHPRLRVEAPASALLTLTVDQGDVRIEGLEGTVSVRVVRGSIRTTGLRGRVRLEIDTGPIIANAVRLAGGHTLKCRTFNGDVTVALAAAPADARILALTLNGAVRSDLPLTTRAAFGPRFGETTVGAGTHVLSVDVVRGDIAITSARTGSGK